MQSHMKRIGRAARLAFFDLLALAALFPILGISFTSYRVTILLVTLACKHLTVPARELADEVKVLYAYVRDEGLDDLKSRLQRLTRQVVEPAKSAYGWISETVSAWLAEAWFVTTYQVHRLTA
jgi:hypothetical protein